MAVEKYYEWLWKYWIYHKFMKLPIEHHIFLAIFSSQKFFWRKIFHKLRVVHNIFFFLLLQAKDEMNSSHFPNHDSLIMHILVMFESDQENTTLSHHLTILFSFLQHFYWSSFPIFFHILFRRLATAIDTSRDT